MEKLLSVLIILAIIIISVTACSAKQKVDAPASSEISQGKRHNGGNMMRDERPTGEQGTGGKSNRELHGGVQDSGISTSGIKNGENSNQNSTENTITGKVKSIVGNEVVLVVTKNASVTDKENIAERESTELPNSELPEGESANKEFTRTYLIPVGMAIGNKDFSSIKAGDTLKIYFGIDLDDKSKIITAVELR